MEVVRSTYLPEFTVVVRIPVQWGDQDAFGHVNNTVYARWFESGRIAYFSKVGISTNMEKERIGPILAAVNVNFRRSVTFPDTIEVGARVTRIGRSSLSIEHKIFSHALKSVCAEGDSTLVIFNYMEQKSHPVPDHIRAGIEKLEGQSF